MTTQMIKTNTDKNYLNFLKQAEKVGKTVFVNKHILSNVCHTPDGKVYTTDSHRAYVYNSHDMELKGNYVVNPKTGEELETNDYPINSLKRNVDHCKENPQWFEVTFEVTRQIVAQLKAMGTFIKKCDDTRKNSAFKISVKKDGIALTDTIENDLFDVNYNIPSNVTLLDENVTGDNIDFYHVGCDFFTEMLETFLVTGNEEVTLKLYSYLKPLTFESENLFGLLMPIRTF